MKKKHVEYEVGLVTYVDILGFGELIRTKTAGEISRTIRVVKPSSPMSSAGAQAKSPQMQPIVGYC